MAYKSTLSFIFLFLLLGNAGFVWAADCDLAYQKAVQDGPLAEADLILKMRCVHQELISKKKTKTVHVCVFSGSPKSTHKETYGTGDLAIISAETPEGTKEFEPLTGEWFAYKGVDRKTNSGLEEVMVNNSSVGTKILRKSAKEDMLNIFRLERINVSIPEKTLRYEKSLKTKSSSKPQETRSFHCENFELEDPYASKGLDKDGLPIRTGISSRARKTPSTGGPSGASGISGVK